MTSPILAIVFASSLLIAPARYAQSEDQPAPVDDTVDQSAVESPMAPPAVPVYGPAYLQMAENMPFGLWESRLNETLRMYRLGLMTLGDAQEQFRELDGAALGIAAQLQALTPPPTLAHVHQLNIAAASEYAASFESGMASLSGDAAARNVANSHFLRAQDLASQALRELR